MVGEAIRIGASVESPERVGSTSAGEGSSDVFSGGTVVSALPQAARMTRDAAIRDFQAFCFNMIASWKTAMVHLLKNNVLALYHIRFPGWRKLCPDRTIGRRRLTPHKTDLIIPALAGEATAFPDLFWKGHQEYRSCHHIRNENIPPAGGTVGVRTTPCFRPIWWDAPIAARKFPPIPYARSAAIMQAERYSNRRKRRKRSSHPMGSPKKGRAVAAFFFRATRTVFPC
jgi:hypothetical protein